MAAYSETEAEDPRQQEKWFKKHGFNPNEDGTFRVDKFEGQTPVEVDRLFENIKLNVSGGYFESLDTQPFDDRIFVMVCGGPSLADHLEDIRNKASQKDKYLVVCSNMTGGYLLENGITPHVHFILDPQEKKKHDVSPNRVSKETQYWLNVACDPSVFSALKESEIKPYAFLADFESDGKARDAVKSSMPHGKSGLMAIQGGTMAGLRAINLADALGFRNMEYYGFDATAKIADKKAALYAYEKKRGEAIIEVECDQCGEKFDTTLILQKQVNEFLEWSRRMPWIDIKIIGGGLIAHCQKHYWEHKSKAFHSPRRFTEEYKRIQKELHSEGNYGGAGKKFVPTVFHGVSQLAKRLGGVSVLDYGSSTGETMKALREHLWLPPTVVEMCYDPFLDEFSAEPEPADFVICTDVMEHVEPECTQAVLDHIRDLTKRIVFFSIALVPARKVLSDGRNAHINLRDAEFWMTEIQKRFLISEAKASQEYVLVIAQSLNDVRERMKEKNERLAA
jgi:hypothetical protein